MRQAASISIGIITFILLFPAFGSSACAGADDGCIDETTTLMGITYSEGWIWLGMPVAIAAGLAVAFAIWSFGGGSQSRTAGTDGNEGDSSLDP